MYTVTNLNNMMNVTKKINHGELMDLFKNINPSIDVEKWLPLTEDYCTAYADSNQPIIKVISKDYKSYLVYVSKEYSEVTWS